MGKSMIAAVFAIALSSVFAWLQAADAQKALGSAPFPVGSFQVTSPRQIGDAPWDGVFVLPKEDFAVLRRDDALFSLEMKPDAEAKKLCSNPMLRDSRVKDGIRADGRLWLFMESVSRSAPPFAIDAGSGKACVFEAPGPWLSTSSYESFESLALLPPMKIALAVASRSGFSLLAPGRFQRTRAFSLDLTTGLSTPFPESWALRSVGKDLRSIVVSDAELRKALKVEIPSLKPLGELKGGEYKSFVDIWSFSDRVCLLHDGNGLLADGVFVPFDKFAKRASISVADPSRLKDGFVALNLQVGTNSPVRIFRVADGRYEEGPAVWTRDFFLLGGGSSIFKDLSGELFFREPGGVSSWNLLSGLADAEKLPPFYQAGQFVVSFGSDERGALALLPCEISSALIPGMASGPSPRPLLVDSQGRRYLLDGKLPGGRKWLHSSGLLLLEDYVYSPQRGCSLSKLSLCRLSFPKD